MGKSSISMGHLYHGGYVSHNQKVKNTAGSSCTPASDIDGHDMFPNNTMMAAVQSVKIRCPAWRFSA